MKWLLALPLLAAMAPASAGETISVCYNYGCLAQSKVYFVDAQLAQVQALLGSAQNAAEEREKLSLTIGWLLGWAGRQTPIAADRGGNAADEGVYGRMDCIDHSTTDHTSVAPAGSARLAAFPSCPGAGIARPLSVRRCTIRHR
jgi:hypothetical protein